ncbi:hypothetical protein ACOSQ4_003268 [Xanthoceras sorbifolium]
MTERLSDRLIDVRRTLDRRNFAQGESPTTKERAFSGTSPLPITQEGGPLSCGIVLDRTQARLHFLMFM